MNQPTGIRMRGDGIAKSHGGTESPGEKRLVDRFFLKGEQADPNFGMGVV